MELSDVLLVSRAAEGDVVAYEALVRRYQLRVFRHCWNMLGDREAAADAAQDVFFTVWRAIGRYRAEASFSTYLYRVATNRCLKELRRRRELPAPIKDRPASEGAPDAEAEAAEMAEVVRRAVAALTPEQRAPLLLREVEGLGYGEIATVLGVSISAVKSRLNRARVEVARRVDEQR